MHHDDLAMICFQKLDSLRKILFYSQGIRAIITFQFRTNSLAGGDRIGRHHDDLAMICFQKLESLRKILSYSQGIRAIITFQ